jgi:hypothetical protein
MPVAKGLPERPQAKNYGISDTNNPQAITFNVTTFANYLKELNTYIDALENWIDIRAFQDGDDEETIETKVQKANELEKTRINLFNAVLTQLCIIDEKTVKEFVNHKWPNEGVRAL